MKYHYRIYAKALAATAAKHLSPEAVTKGAHHFLAVLERNGDRAALPKIVALAEELFLKRGGKKKVVVESARPLVAHARAELENKFAKGDVIEEKIVPSLIAGVRITVNGEEQLDMSFSHKMNKLFT
ncbi:MAG: hypothetical protein A2946_02460 [Candidatus Liptonbacteria bacterium RIFCSPLOWO2_01_FULL_53_13]|uniref:Uncharacterized protein n=1 Tax=Candidatus Liptonbacteria bacterium RIFCSPLOWO2_01_FULL_53_13 TaxID=1798651 RepID=A0A1G2CLQ2_9BACT|nr:MAG: hypothetical protein A2946_02460 [Candidatus Liptonbacteria bacterium RIFCSPLOWO2_01_FULL_53_13]